MKRQRFSAGNKYGAKRTSGYSSKREAQYAAELAVRKSAAGGDVLDWLEQVPIRLPGGVIYRVDFMVFLRDGSWELVEVKGFETAEWRLKCRLLAEVRPHLWAKLKVVK